jgi:hypothetical protein
MLAVSIWIIKFIIVFAVINFIMSFFMKKKEHQPRPNQKSSRRFEDEDKKVVDADFKEL